MKNYLKPLPVNNTSGSCFIYFAPAMKDDFFISSILFKGEEARQKVLSGFSGLSAAQLNWQAAPGNWSIAQCLQHLIVSDSCYFDALKKIISGNYKMNAWQKYSPFTRWCGKILVKQFRERPTRKRVAPKKIRPVNISISPGIIKTYLNTFDQFSDYIAACRNIDIDKTILTSPTISMVTYSLRDAFQFLLQHEHRHINQALKVKGHKEFPL